MTEIHYYGKQKNVPTVANVGIRGRLGRSVQTLKGYTRGEVPGADQAGKSINQAIDIATGEINIHQIIKYAIYFVILCGLVIFTINFARGIMIVGQQAALEIGNFGCFGGCRFITDIDNPNSDVTNVFWLWEVEWVWRCLFYLGCALVVGLFLYQFSAYLLGRLLGVDNDIKKFDKALFGSNWERSEEEEHRTRF
jgi:hypothetical protein